MKGISLALLALLSLAAAAGSNASDIGRPQSYPDLLSNVEAKSPQGLAPGIIRLSPAETDRLILPQAGAVHRLPSFDRFTGNERDPLQFRRLALFAEDARIRVVGAREVRELSRPVRQYYLAYNGTTAVGLAVDPVSGAVSGVVAKDGGRLKFQGGLVTDIQFTEIDDSQYGTSSCGNVDQDLSGGAPQVEADPYWSSISAAAAGSVISYQAVVAVDTDTEWLDGFGDDPVAAMEWITDLFLAMNVFYERDVETQLLLGDVTLRTGSDPYSAAGSTFDRLAEFGDYWMNHMGGVDRQFATMFSGRNISSWSFSGVAWINSYCQNGFTATVNGRPGTVVGSYSYNAIGANLSPAFTALYVGHELGHNMGSPHTHCYSPAVDQCYNGEGGCYSGATSCPAGGRGTIMSYCHLLGNCSNSSEFHPTVQSRLENRLANQMVAGCIIPYEEASPEPEYLSSPAAGSQVHLGEQEVGGTSGPQSIQIQNVGNDDLTLACGLSGPDSGDFAIQNCPALLIPAATGDIQVTCSPGTTGSLAATLTVTTNDSDEGENEYALLCTGVAAALGDAIFVDSFEN